MLEKLTISQKIVEVLITIRYQKIIARRLVIIVYVAYNPAV